MEKINGAKHYYHTQYTPGIYTLGLPNIQQIMQFEMSSSLDHIISQITKMQQSHNLLYTSYKQGNNYKHHIMSTLTDFSVLHPQGIQLCIK